MGLAIAKAIMDMHGGQISANSEGSNLGSCFTIQLLLAKVKFEVITQEPLVPTQARSGAKILLVEDHPDTAKILSRLLGSLGYSVKMAHTVTEGLQLATSEKFDLLLSDIGLPDASGYELMNRIRQFQDTPGIAISGFGMESDILKSREAGFVDHVVKPVNVTHLHSIIQRVMNEVAA